MECFFIGGEQLLSFLRQHIRGSKETRIAVAYARDSGVKLLLEDIEFAVRSGSKVRVLTSFEDHCVREQRKSQVKALCSLLEAGADVRLHRCQEGELHSKVYLIQLRDETVLVVGSTNLSGTAFQRNVEANLAVKGKDSSLFRESGDWFEMHWTGKAGNQVLAVTQSVLAHMEKHFTSRGVDETHVSEGQVDIL